MKQETKDGYIGSIALIIGALIFLVFAVNSGLNTATNQIVAAIGSVFGLLGVGGLFRPDSIGAIAAQIAENLARNVSEDSASPRQTQRDSTGSPQISAGGDVNYNQTIYETKRNRKRKQ